jgi:FixJ family two-component response regulator
MTPSVAVYVVDDDSSYLLAVCRMLRAAGFETRMFDSGAGLLAQVSPDARGCVVADLQMPDLSGLELQGALARSGALLPVVFLTGQGDIPSSVQAMRQGAVDFLEKGAPQEQLIAAVTRALQRDEADHAAHARREGLRRRFSALTQREREVLQLVVDGRMNKQIAAALGINERTVKLHRSAMTRKVGARSVAELTTLVREANVLGPERPG